MTLYEFVKKYSISRALFVIYFTFFALIFYFAFSIIFSQKGLVKYFSLRQEIRNQNISKKELVDKIKSKKNKLEGMNPNSLDLDLLDEEARKNLGFSNKNEIIIYHEKNDEK